MTLDVAIQRYERKGERIRTMSLFHECTKEMNSSRKAEDVLKILLANGVISVPAADNIVGIASHLRVKDLKGIRKLLSDYKKVKDDPQRLWVLVNDFKTRSSLRADPKGILFGLRRAGHIEAGADPVELDPVVGNHADDNTPRPGGGMPGTENTTGNDDDLPPLPPLEDYQDGQGNNTNDRNIDADDLPPRPPMIGDMSDYGPHLALIQKACEAGDEKLSGKAVKALKAAMLKHGERHPSASLQDIAKAAIRQIASNITDFPDVGNQTGPNTQTDPLPIGTSFPDTTPIADPFPDTGPTGVDLSGLGDWPGTGGNDDDSDGGKPFPEPSGKAEPILPGKPDPFSDDDPSPPNLDFGDQTPGGTDGYQGEVGQNKIQAHQKIEVTNFAELIAEKEFEQAKNRAIQASKTLIGFGAPKDAVSSRNLLVAAGKRASKSQGVTPQDEGSVELTLAHAKTADWKMFSKTYEMDDESVASCRDIANQIVKGGLDDPKAKTMAKPQVAQLKKDKKAKFKNVPHLIAAVDQLVEFKATREKLKKPLKASAVPDAEENLRAANLRWARVPLRWRWISLSCLADVTLSP